jgi:polyphosphate kinase
VDAAEGGGKSVTAVVELKAGSTRSRTCLGEPARSGPGVQCVYGFIDWKPTPRCNGRAARDGGVPDPTATFGHRQLSPGHRTHLHDLSFFTPIREPGRDAAQLFNYITGYVEPQELELLTISPIGMRERLSALIDGESTSPGAGARGRSGPR